MKTFTDFRQRLPELRQRLRLALAILRGRDGATLAHVHRETAHMRRGGDGPDRWMADHLADMARCFDTGGHSGFSSSFVVAHLGPLLRFEPLGPLTGEENEWTVLGYNDDMQAQNKRCSHVFRRADGTAYDSTAVIFREPNGVCFTGKYSRADVAFPYTPKRVYANVPEDRSDEQMAEAAALALAAGAAA